MWRKLKLIQETTCYLCKTKSQQIFFSPSKLPEESELFLDEKCNIGEIQQCPHCYYAARNISLAVSEKIAQIVASADYQKIANTQFSNPEALQESDYHAYAGYSYLCKKTGDDKNELFAAIKAAQIKKSVAYQMLTSHSPSGDQSFTELMASFLLAEALDIELKAYDVILHWANLRPESAAMVYLLLKNCPTDHLLLSQSIALAENFLQSNDCPIHIQTAIRNQMAYLKKSKELLQDVS